MYQVSAPRLTAHQFARKWAASSLKERSAAQEHFIDLCHLLGEQTPAEADPRGEWYCFERGAAKTGGGNGWADVWRRHCFAWEYKGKHADLDAAFAQLQRYALALENPPLLVVSDMARIEVHTNFTNSVHEKHVIPIADLGASDNLLLLKNVFADPEKLRPGKTKTAITEDAAERFAALAQVLRDRGGEPQRVAHFLNRILFCLFAQDAKLLPDGVVRQLLQTGIEHPDQGNEMLKSLFNTMKSGGVFGTHVIEWFNGNLFDSNDAVPLKAGDIQELLAVAGLDWSAIEPSIFGTCFERGLDPDKRSQIGAHYTDWQSIMRIVQPVVLDPLNEEWDQAKHAIRAFMGRADKSANGSVASKLRKESQDVFHRFLVRLAEFRVLDPACGSGNFLYVALQALKDLEHRATLEAEQIGLQASFTGTHVGVQCLQGIESNAYAAELARVTVWIGEIQWMLRHGVPPTRNPILKPLKTIECRDAILTEGGLEAQWPNSDAIIGNPPFLGDKKMVGKLGKAYVSVLRKRFNGRILGGADLVTYWFEKARAQVESGSTARVGLVATNSIRGGANRKVLERILLANTIFDAWSDEPWINEGAAVRVSLICFRHGSENEGKTGRLDGKSVTEIFADLAGSSEAGSSDVTLARALAENAGVAFSGITKKGAFDLPGEVARTMVRTSGNPNRKSNLEVLFPWKNGEAITGRDLDKWIINFGERSLADAARYEAPFEHVRREVFPQRSRSNTPGEKARWWLLARRANDFFAATRSKRRYIATPEVSKHRVFVWLPTSVVPDKNLVAIAREDDATFGILSSRFHAVWARKMGTSLEDRPRYTSTTTFRTFPFPPAFRLNAPRKKQKPREHETAIARAATALDKLREAWLNPLEWVELVTDIDPRLPARLLPLAGREMDLRKRTLTNLYNAHPAWLGDAHAELDRAVAAAYGWRDYTAAFSDEEIVSRLLQLNIERHQDLFTVSDEPASGQPASKSARSVRPSEEILDRRLAVVCTLINRLADDPNFGRTKMAKLFYLADVTQELGLQTTYDRKAAGPLDTATLYSGQFGLEVLALRRGYAEGKKNGRMIRYTRGPKIEAGYEKARGILGKKRTPLNRLIDLFRKLDTDQCEIVATLYACWNDLLLDGRKSDAEAIVDEFLNGWHEKKRRFANSRARLVNALKWMESHQLVPHGRTPHTQIARR